MAGIHPSSFRPAVPGLRAEGEELAFPLLTHTFFISTPNTTTHMKKKYMAPTLSVIEMDPLTPVATSPTKPSIQVDDSGDGFDPTQSLSVRPSSWQKADDVDDEDDF